MTARNKNIPVLRFKEFSPSWKTEKLGSIAEITSGGTPNRSNKKYWNGKIPWISTSLIDFNVILQADEYITDEGVANSSAKLFPIGTILMAMYGQGKTRGKVSVLGIQATTNQACAAIIVKEEIKTDFIYQNLKGRYDEIRNLSNEGGQKNLSGGIIKDINVCFPSLPEQQKIASFLSAIDEKIRQLTHRKELLEQYKKGVMQQLFSGKLRFKPALSGVEGDEKGKAYPKWEEKKLGDVITNKSPKHNPQNDSELFKCIELEHLTSNTGSLLGYSDSSSSSSIKNKFKKGDVLFGKLRPYLRKFLLAPFDGVCSSEIWVLKGEGILNEFVYRIIQTDYFIDLANQSTGSKMPRADWNVISTKIFNIPSLPEQQKIATFFSSLDTKIQSVTAQIARTQEFKKGLLQKMFV